MIFYGLSKKLVFRLMKFLQLNFFTKLAPKLNILAFYFNDYVSIFLLKSEKTSCLKTFSGSKYFFKYWLFYCTENCFIYYTFLKINVPFIPIQSFSY